MINKIRLTKKIYAALCALALLLPCLPVSAALLSYATNSSGNLYTVDLHTGDTSLIGNSGLGSNAIEGLAITPDGLLYGTDGGGNVYSVSTVNGAATLIGATGDASGFKGLDTLSNGSVYGANWFATPRIWNIDVNDPASSAQLQTANQVTGRVRTMAMQDADTSLFLTNNQGVSEFTRILWSMDMATGVTFNLGTLMFEGSEVQGIEAMDFDASGNLYALTPGGDIYTVNYALGVADSVSMEFIATTPTGEINWRSLAITAVPLPAATPLFVSGLMLMGFACRRKKI